MQKTLCFLATLLAWISLTPEASAAVFEVPSLPYPTIQAAINATTPGTKNTIVVHPGIYTENLVIANRDNLHLVAGQRGVLGGAAPAGVGPQPFTGPTIDGGMVPGQNCITIIDSNRVSIVGFEITNCDSRAIQVTTGGSSVQGFTLHNNYLNNFLGTGVELDKVRDGNISGNRIENSWGGTGIIVFGKNCVVADNHLDTLADHGIWVVSGSVENSIVNNEVQGAFAQGIQDDGASTCIERNNANSIFLTGSNAHVVNNCGGPLVDNGANSWIVLC